MAMYDYLAIATFAVVAMLLLWFGWTLFQFKSRIRGLIDAATADQGALRTAIPAWQINGSDEETSAPGPLDRNFLSRRRSSGPLSPAWRAIEQALVPGASGQALAANPQDIFSPDLLYGKDVDLRRFEAFPNILVGAGLAATFALLAITIWIGIDTLSNKDVQSIAAIKPLLEASALKFITSIAGVSCSILFIIFRNHEVLAAETALAELADTLADAVPQVSQQAVLSSLLAQSLEQTRLAKARNRDLATAVAKSVREELEGGLVTALQPIADQMTNLSQRVADVNAKQIEMMATAFARDLGIAIEKYSRTLSEQLKQSVDLFAQVPPAIEAAATAYAAAVDDSALRLRNSTNNAGEVYDRIEASLRNLNSAVEVAETRLVGTVNSLREEVNSGAEGLRTARSALIEAQPIIEILRNAAPAGAALSSAADIIARAGGAVPQALVAWKLGLEELDMGLERVISRVDELLTRATENPQPVLPTGDPAEPALEQEQPQQKPPVVDPAIEAVLPTPGNPEILTFRPSPISGDADASEAPEAGTDPGPTS